ncbi:hypothetical protein NDU88_004705 [Pleurodeles waltl]|uniref:Uncharacterized protein n=1 Tax=Pleurodeles waltl TaxID=8319 RepID=A0AAV7QIL6_PLEWA|nr:hypothetical protein NDU88_004705 [Pleurodeles waltl]
MMDARTEDPKILLRCIQTLEIQHLELQAMQEDLEHPSQQNNIRLRGVPRDQEAKDIMAYMVALLHALRGISDAPLS